MEKFGLLTLTENKSTGWVKCKCDCGNDYFGQYRQLKIGKVKSCGCWKRKREIQIGMSQTPFYNVYRNILRRCNLPNNPNYKNYGGRGIKCEWKDFQEFYSDMHNSYKEGLTIERENNNGNYSKSNCKWVTQSDQLRNRRNTIIYNGKCLMDTLIERNFNDVQINRVYSRIKRGKWDIERAMNENNPTTSEQKYKHKKS